jgi:hypothetical protein
MEVRKIKISAPQRACMVQTREETNTEASVLNTPLATLSTLNARQRGCRVFVPTAMVTGDQLSELRWRLTYFGIPRKAFSAFQTQIGSVWRRWCDGVFEGQRSGLRFNEVIN